MVNDKFNPEEEFKKFLNDIKDDLAFEKRQKRPSQYLLEMYAEKILEIAHKWQSLNQYSLDEVTSVKSSIDIFLADLDSDLSINNDKKYSAIWIEKLDKLKFIQHQFITKYKENISNNL